MAQREPDGVAAGGQRGRGGALGIAGAPDGEAVVEVGEGGVELHEKGGVARVRARRGPARVRAEVRPGRVEAEPRARLDPHQRHHRAHRQPVGDADFQADRRDATLRVDGEQALAQARHEAGETAGGAHVLLEVGQGRAGGGADGIAGQRPAERPAPLRREGGVPDHRLGIEGEPHRAALGRVGALDGLRPNAARERGEGRNGEAESQDRSH